MLSVLYLPNGIFIKPREIEFDPHVRVGHVLVENGVEEMIKYKKFMCKCYLSDRVHIDREIVVTSIDPRSGIALFKYEDFIPNPVPFFDPNDIKEVLTFTDMIDLIDSLNDLIEQSIMGMNVHFSSWVEKNSPAGFRKSLSRFAFSYYRFYTEKFTDLNELKKNRSAIAFSLYEIGQKAQKL
jgi:hypothetical protein